MVAGRLWVCGVVFVLLASCLAALALQEAVRGKAAARPPAQTSNLTATATLTAVQLEGATQAVVALPCSIVVQRGESLQAAIDAAPEGAVLCLSAGEWWEHLTIGKTLTLRGAGAYATAIRGSCEGVPVIHVQGAGEGSVAVALAELGVTGGMGMWAGDGLLIEDTAKLRVDGCAVSGNAAAGIRLMESARAEVNDSTISGNATFGIGLGQAATAVIDSCTLAGNGLYCIALTGRAVATISNCTISENIYSGIEVRESAQATITGCTVSGNAKEAIAVMHSARAAIAGCTISGNTKEGIWITGSAEAAIRSNRILGNGRSGVALFEGTCYDTDSEFTGRVSGGGNTIPSLGEPNENRPGAFCPDVLQFLISEEGGELDRRQAPSSCGPRVEGGT